MSFRWSESCESTFIAYVCLSDWFMTGSVWETDFTSVRIKFFASMIIKKLWFLPTCPTILEILPC
jgi:hypothetical protein